MEDRIGEGDGYKGASLYGQTLDWHGRGQLTGCQACVWPALAGREAAKRHSVDDFQKPDQNKVCVKF